MLTEAMASTNAHRLLVTAWLAALARQHGLALATLDERLSRDFPDEPRLVELVV